MTYHFLVMTVLVSTAIGSSASAGHRAPFGSPAVLPDPARSGPLQDQGDEPGDDLVHQKDEYGDDRDRHQHDGGRFHQLLPGRPRNLLGLDPTIAEEPLQSVNLRHDWSF